MSGDVAKVADKLNLNQVRTMTWWSKGGVIQCDVPRNTQHALVKRGLAEWPPGEDLCASLTPLGLEVQKHLNAKAEAEDEARTQALARESAEKWKFRQDGYDEGHRIGQTTCVRELYEAVYLNDAWPDRPLDTIWNHLLEQVRKAVGNEDAAQPPSSEASPQ